MITKLTQEQEAAIPRYLPEGLAIGLRITSIDKQKATEAIKAIWTFLGADASIINVSFHASPLACQKARIAGGGNKSFNNQYFTPLYWLGYYQHYKFILEQLLPEKREEFKLLYSWLEWAQQLHYVENEGNNVYVSDFPTQINMVAGRLHGDGKPAFEYADGFKAFALNGVTVTEEIAMTPADELDPQLILKERNAEVRRELFRKIGPTNVVSKLKGRLVDNAKIDISSEAIRDVFGVTTRVYDYELYEVNLGNGNVHPFLRMWNPSIEAQHFEPVPKGTKTVQEALAFRNGLDKWVAPTVLT